MGLSRMFCRLLTAKMLIFPVLLLIMFGDGHASWFDLEAGPFGVGFAKLEKYDHSRVFRSKTDYFGNPIEGERARPIQICYWYPAEIGPDASSMVYGEYSFPYPESDQFFGFVTQLQNRERQNLFGRYRAAPGIPLDLMSVKMRAVLDAPAAAGQFPLLIYIPDFRGSYSENAILCEFLASHGYVVAAAHSVGTRAVNPVTSQGDLETLLSDNEFLFASMCELSFVDSNKLGVFGAGFGGLESMLLTMRNSDIDAMAGLMGLFVYKANFEFIRQCPYYAIDYLSVPVMNIYATDNIDIDLSLIESLKYSDRYSIASAQLGSDDFTSYDLLASQVPGHVMEDFEGKKDGYRKLCFYVLRFFDAHVKNDKEGLEFLTESKGAKERESADFNIKFIAGRTLPPSQTEFMAIIQEKGVGIASEIYYKFKDDNPDHVFFPEAPMNALGYQYLQTNNIDNAITIFKMNTEAYPQSCNVWDSYADGLTARGDTALVRQAMLRAMEVMSDDSLTNEQTKAAIRAHADQVLGAEEINTRESDGGNDNE